MAEPDMDVRRRILNLVEEYPGLHLREIQRRAGCSAMLAEYHLNILEELGLVTSSTRGRYRDFFPARHEVMPLDRCLKTWLGLLRRPPILGITLLLLEKRSLRPVEVAEEMRLPSSTAAYQIKTMHDTGLTVQEQELGVQRVRLADPEAVLRLLRAYHPTPDALSRYALMWTRILSKPRPVRPEADEEAPGPPPEVAALPPSTQSVYQALRKGPMTQKGLCLETGHARRTVYSALRRLEKLGVLESQPDLRDTRQSRYWLKE